MSIQAVAWVLENSTAELGARLALIAIANHAHVDGTGAYPSYETIGKEARMDRRSAIEAIKRLEADGHIKVLRNHGRGNSNHYIILGLASTRSGGDVTSPFNQSPPVDNSVKGGEKVMLTAKKGEASITRTKGTYRTKGASAEKPELTGPKFPESTPEYQAQVEAIADLSPIKAKAGTLAEMKQQLGPKRSNPRPSKDDPGLKQAREELRQLAERRKQAAPP